MMKTAFNTNSGLSGYTMPSLKEIIEIISRAGLDGIELNAEIFFGPKNRHAGLDISDEQIKETKKLCKNYGLKVSSIGAHFSFLSKDPKMRERNLREYKKCIDQAVILGAEVVHGFSGGPGKNQIGDEEELWRIFKSGCTEVLDYAKDKGIMFGIEPVITHLVYNYDSVKKMFEVINRGDLYLNYDPCHLYMSEPANGHLKMIDEFGEKIIHVHTHDAVGMAEFNWEDFIKKDKVTWENMRPFGCGEIDWKQVVKSLKKKGFDGFLSFEYGIQGWYVPGYKFYIETVAKSYNHLMKQIITQVSATSS